MLKWFKRKFREIDAVDGNKRWEHRVFSFEDDRARGLDYRRWKFWFRSARFLRLCRDVRKRRWSDDRGRNYRVRRYDASVREAADRSIWRECHLSWLIWHPAGDRLGANVHLLTFESPGHPRYPAKLKHEMK